MGAVSIGFRWQQDYRRTDNPILNDDGTRSDHGLNFGTPERVNLPYEEGDDSRTYGAVAWLSGTSDYDCRFSGGGGGYPIARLIWHASDSNHIELRLYTWLDLHKVDTLFVNGVRVDMTGSTKTDYMPYPGYYANEFEWSAMIPRRAATAILSGNVVQFKRTGYTEFGHPHDGYIRLHEDQLWPDDPGHGVGDVALGPTSSKPPLLVKSADALAAIQAIWPNARMFGGRFTDADFHAIEIDSLKHVIDQLDIYTHSYVSDTVEGADYDCEQFAEGTRYSADYMASVDCIGIIAGDTHCWNIALVVDGKGGFRVIAFEPQLSPYVEGWDVTLSDSGRYSAVKHCDIVL